MTPLSPGRLYHLGKRQLVALLVPYDEAYKRAFGLRMELIVQWILRCAQWRSAHIRTLVDVRRTEGHKCPVVDESRERIWVCRKVEKVTYLKRTEPTWNRLTLK